MKSLLLIIGVVFSVAVAAQTHREISGRVVDASTGEPLSYVNIGVKGEPHGCASNADGNFTLKIPYELWESNVYIRCSYIGYRSYELAVQSLEKTPDIPLKPAAIQLQEVVIEGMEEGLTAEEILLRAFGSIKNNYPREPYLLQTFYRHYCKEDTSYGRLIEAAVDVYNPRGHQRFFNHPRSKVALRVNQLRRSYDFTQNFLKHDAISIYSLLEHDYTSYETPLHGVPTNYSYQLVDTTFFDGVPVLVIAYHLKEDRGGKERHEMTRVDGKLYVAENTNAILKIEETDSLLIAEGQEQRMDALHWMLVFREYEGQYYLNYVMEEGYTTEQKQLESGDTLSWDHFFHVEMMTNKVVTEGIKPFKGKEPNREALAKMPYQQKFWDRYTTLQQTPLDKKILQDLENEYSLQLQFRENQPDHH